MFFWFFGFFIYSVLWTVYPFLHELSQLIKFQMVCDMRRWRELSDNSNDFFQQRMSQRKVENKQFAVFQRFKSIWCLSWSPFRKEYLRWNFRMSKSFCVLFIAFSKAKPKDDWVLFSPFDDGMHIHPHAGERAWEENQFHALWQFLRVKASYFTKLMRKISST